MIIKTIYSAIMNWWNKQLWGLYVKAYNKKIWLPNKQYQKLQYYLNTGKRLNIKNPKLYQEKIQWLKLYYHNPIMTTLVDKAGVRDYIKSTIGEEYLVPVYGIYDKWSDIDFDALPNEFVIKCTHDSGSVSICKNKSNWDKIKAREIIEKSLSMNYFWRAREWAYKNVKPRIIIEEYLKDNKFEDAPDYKFFCFDGKVRMFRINTGRHSKEGLKSNFYELPWKRMDIGEQGYANNLEEETMPAQFEKMVQLAELLSNGFPHVRIDFNYINDKIYFGEFTFYHNGGRHLFNPYESNIAIGNWLKLPKKIK